MQCDRTSTGTMGRVTRLALGLVAVLFLLVVAYRNMTSSSRSEIRDDLAEIFIAIEQYTTNRNKPLTTNFQTGGVERSWRVEIYPWLASNQFTGGYDTGKPFDNEANLKVASRVKQKESTDDESTDPGSCFRSAEDEDARTNGWTSYLMVSGSDFPGFNPHVEYPDGNANTIILIYLPSSGVYWTEPKDVSVSKNGSSNEQFERWLKIDDKVALFGDGAIRVIARGTSRDEIEAMCTAAGGEMVQLDRHVEIKR